MQASPQECGWMKAPGFVNRNTLTPNISPGTALACRLFQRLSADPPGLAIY